ncbi:MAG TPA: septal ring lytic transglycosylase RlpA family protein [Candidatus Hydrogenedentes bacterium]|mgnify:CR=1 FL=1|nr:septal ring lytic transglycosylase RlpA family protein [Candidatus Hydrogenedentota bacterium]
MFEIMALVLLTQQPLQPVAEGLASYYTTRENSSITASGEPMVDSDFTCAMRKGTFGDYFLVVADNGRSVVCRLNDRGPHVKGRVIDLSRAAMRALSPHRDLVRVRVYRLGASPPPNWIAAKQQKE